MGFVLGGAFGLFMSSVSDFPLHMDPSSFALGVYRLELMILEVDELRHPYDCRRPGYPESSRERTAEAGLEGYGQSEFQLGEEFWDCGGDVFGDGVLY